MPFFKPKKFKPETLPVTPYQRAADEWDRRIGAARTQAKNWRAACLFVTCACMILSGGMVYQSSQSSVTPYVVRVNSEGIAEAIGPARQANYTPTEKEIKHFLTDLVIKARSISTDPVIVKQNFESVYAFLSDSGQAKMNGIAAKENPVAKIGSEAVTVEISSIVPQSKTTYQIRWIENIYDISGTQTGATRMTGLFTIEFKPPTSEKALLMNPLGLFIKDFNWTKEVNESTPNG